MATETHLLTIRVAWWARWYLSGVALMCRMTGCEPDWERVEHWINRSIKVRVE